MDVASTNNHMLTGQTAKSSTSYVKEIITEYIDRTVRFAEAMTQENRGCPMIMVLPISLAKVLRASMCIPLITQVVGDPRPRKHGSCTYQFS